MKRLTWSQEALVLALAAPLLSTACGSDDAPGKAWECQYESADTAPDYLQELGCQADFEALASEPLDSSLPGARAVKTVIDLEDEGTLYFQDSNKFSIHYEFASEYLSVANGFSPVPDLASFNEVQYTSPERRFILGTVIHYEGPDLWVYEIAPYDRASAEMIQQAYETIAQHAFFGDKLVFHPSSVTVEGEAEDLPDSVKQVSTDELYEGVTYQPLNLAESIGRLTFVTAADLETQYLTFRDIAVLDHVPNDISVTLGIITAEFQTPLAHINVLSQNRGTPNMALKGAYDNEELRALEGKWVRLKVGAFDYEIEEVSQEEADAFWEANKPSTVMVPGANRDVTDLRDITEAVVFEDGSTGEEKRLAIKEATRAFGGKAAHYSVLAQIDGVPTPPAFSVPVYHYFKFMADNGFEQRVSDLLADDDFVGDPATRDAALATLRDDMQAAPLDAEFEQMLMDKLAAAFPASQPTRFRSSTNAEDLDGFTGAGLYDSKTGIPGDPTKPVADAVRKVWSSVWYFRAFEERSYRGIDHLAVGMALLVHRSFPDEEANGVALTDNPYDKSGLEPAFYVNVQYGDESVVLPPAGVTTDQFLYYYLQSSQPTTYLSYSSLAPEGSTSVLSRVQVKELGDALQKIREFFTPIYGSSDWWAMDVEFKFDGEDGEEPALYVKQARPFGDR